eukprot:2465-Heterococcus_DN1.PRE.1
MPFYLCTKRHTLLYDLHNTGELLSRQLVDVCTVLYRLCVATTADSADREMESDTTVAGVQQVMATHMSQALDAM